MTEVNFTECERIEILRRRYEMNSLIGLMPRLFYQEDEANALRIHIKKNVFWCYAAILGGALLDWFLHKGPIGFEINVGSIIMMLGLWMLLFYSFTLDRNTRDLQVNYDKRSAWLQRWEAATGSKYDQQDLYEFGTRFYRDGNIATDGKDYEEWWQKHYHNIVFRVQD